MTKLNKPTTNATVTPTVNKASIAKCGIPAPAPNGRNNLKLALADDAVARLNALEKPLAPQAQAILYTLDQLGGAATQGALIKALDDGDVLATTQGATRIVTFYRKKLIENGLIKVGA